MSRDKNKESFVKYLYNSYKEDLKECFNFFGGVVFVVLIPMALYGYLLNVMHFPKNDAGGLACVLAIFALGCVWLRNKYMEFKK